MDEALIMALFCLFATCLLKLLPLQSRYPRVLFLSVEVFIRGAI